MSNNKKYILEIATSDFQTTSSAISGGADRIELCANLAEGGTTPSYGLMLKCRQHFSTALYPIIRPRGGDFLYSNEEFEIMIEDVKRFRDAGCDGIVTGLLLADGNIDITRTKLLVELAYPLGVTFHRAFDRCRDPFLAIDELIDAGCERILTSGQQPSVMDGIELVKKLNEVAAERIIIMPGSGVRAENISLLRDQTGCIEFHSSLRSKKSSNMKFIHPAFKDSSESYLNNAVEPDEVRELKRQLAQAGS